MSDKYDGELRISRTERFAVVDKDVKIPPDLVESHFFFFSLPSISALSFPLSLPKSKYLVWGAVSKLLQRDPRRSPGRQHILINVLSAALSLLRGRFLGFSSMPNFTPIGATTRV